MIISTIVYIYLKIMIIKPVEDVLVTGSGIVMGRNTVTGVGLDVGREVLILNVGEGLRDLMRNGRGRATSRKAVTTAEGEIAVTGEDEDGASEVIRSRSAAANGEDLAEGDGLLALLDDWQDLRVEVGGQEELILVRARVRRDDIAVRKILRRRQGRNVNWLQIIEQRRLLEQEVRHNTSVTGAAKAERRVDRGLLQVATSEEITHERGVEGEASQDDALCQARVEVCEDVGLDGAEGVTDVHDGVIGRVDTREVAIAELGCQGVQGGNFEIGLDLVEWVAMLGLADTQAIVAQGHETSIQGGIDVGIVEVVVGKIPVRLVKTNSVGQDLQSRAVSGLLVIPAELSADIIGSAGGVVALQNIIGEVMALTGHSLDELRDFNIVVRDDAGVKYGATGFDIDGNSLVKALLRSRNYGGKGQARCSGFAKHCG